MINFRKFLALLMAACALTSGAAMDVEAAGKITNTATVDAVPARGTLGSPPAATVEIDLAGPPPTVSITITATDGVSVDFDGNVGSPYPDMNDVVNLLVVITNTSEVSLEGVRPSDFVASFGPDRRLGDRVSSTIFAGYFDSGASSADLNPGDSFSFFAVYSISRVDALLAAITGYDSFFTVGATSSNYQDLQVTANEASVYFFPYASLKLSKTYDFMTDAGTVGEADVGDVIRYTYEVSNNGNVAVRNINVSDVHEGVALPVGAIAGAELIEDGALAVLGGVYTSVAFDTGTDTIWPVLQPGAKIRFYYSHVVTQEEVDAAD